MLINEALLFIHLIGFAFGLGGATVSDLQFFLALKNRCITNEQYSFFLILSKICWIGFFLLLFSGVGLVYREYQVTKSFLRFHDPFFLAKLTAVAIIFVNGVAFRYLVFPFLGSDRYKKLDQCGSMKNWHAITRTGAISILSWYAAASFAVLDFSLGYGTLILIYLLVLASGVGTARIMVKRYLNDGFKT